MSNKPDRNTPTCPWGTMSRREFLRIASLSALSPTAFMVDTTNAPTTLPRTPTSIELCKRYDYDMIREKLGKMFDEIGGVRKLVKNKYVTAKLNLVNAPDKNVNGIPLALTVITHPLVAMAFGSLMVEYGARNVTFCDQLPTRGEAAEDFAKYGYNIADFRQAMDDKVAFENTRNLGSYKTYDSVKVPNPIIANHWEVNQAYTKTDVLVSIGKLKSHVSAGVTFGMKNLFGVPPSSLYGDDLKDEPSERAVGYRSSTMHNCNRKPYTSSTSFVGTTHEWEHGYNVPRFIVDLNSAFPIELVVIDGISTIQSAEGWWIGSIVSPTSPGLLLAGRNPVCTDAVASVVMGFDPDTQSLTPPFANGTNYLRLARTKGLGENRIQNLDVVGIGLEKARFPFQPTYQRIYDQ